MEMGNYKSKLNNKKNKSSDGNSDYSSLSINFKDNIKILAKSIYPLFGNDEDNDRLVYQHYILKELLTGNIHIPNSVIQNFKDKKQNIKILDLGCGTGVWCFDIAEELKDFENDKINIYGTDIDERYPKEIKPKNIKIQFGYMSTLDDINNINLNFIKLSSFDFVYQRLMFAAFTEKDWQKSIENIKKLLKIDGWFEIVDTDSYIKFNDSHLPNISNNVSNMNERWQNFLKNNCINTNLISQLDNILENNNLKYTKVIINVPIGTVKNKIARQFADDWSLAMYNSRDKIKFKNETDEDFNQIIKDFKSDLLICDDYYANFYIYYGQLKN